MYANSQQDFSVAARYAVLKQRRSPYEDRARACARLTVPAAFPLVDNGGDSSTVKIVTPYQGIGAEGVSSLASKMLLALMPPNTPCFRLRVPDQIQREALKEQEGDDIVTRLEKGLSRVEQAVQEHIEASGDRPAMYDGFLQLLIAGNALLYCDKDGGIRLFRLPYYVVRRSFMGVPVEIITHEKVDHTQLPPDVLTIIREQGGCQGLGDDSRDRTAEKQYDLYTYVTRGDKQWFTWQECQGVKVPGSDGSFPLDACPFIPLRMYRSDGEDYGRSFVEQYLGDLKTLEALTQAIIEGSAAAAKVLFMVKPNGFTKPKTLQNAPNGAIVDGDEADVGVLQLGKSSDFRTALETSLRVEQRLAKAFLLVDGTRRDAERVTAEEIRAVANELEAAFGGVYSILAQEFQQPYIGVKLHQLTKAKKIPPLPKSGVRLSIVAGLEALGRGNDKVKLGEFLTGLAGLAQVPPAVLQCLNVTDLLQRFATATSLNPDGLIKDPQTMAQEQQTAQQQQMTQEMMPGLMGMAEKGIGNLPPEMMQEALSGMAGTGDEQSTL